MCADDGITGGAGREKEVAGLECSPSLGGDFWKPSAALKSLGVGGGEEDPLPILLAPSGEEDPNLRCLVSR